MGRPKKGSSKKSDPGGKTVGVRVDAHYSDWLDELARFNRSSISVLFDQAMASYAKSIGFEKPPPQR